MKKPIPVSTPESIANTADVLRMAVETRGFEFMLVNSLKETMRRNGIDLCHGFRTYAIYRLEQASKVLDSASTILRCHISLCREDDKTVLSTIKPTGFPLNADTQPQQLIAAKSRR